MMLKRGTQSAKISEIPSPTDKKMTPEDCEKALKKVVVNNMSRPQWTKTGFKRDTVTREDFKGEVGKDNDVDQVIEYGMKENLIETDDDGQTYSPTEDGVAFFWP